MTEWITYKDPVGYEEMHNIMLERVEDIINRNGNEIVFSLEHKPVITAGISAKPEELLLTPTNIPIINTRRGGKYTYHGPGQTVLYPILNLASTAREKDIKKYIRTLEQWIISTLDHLGIKAFAVKNMVGIWVMYNGDLAKIAAIGVKLRKWVTFHGIAVNVNPNLQNYNAIIPCGISHFPVTSLYQLGCNVTKPELDAILKTEFGKLF